MNLEARIKQTQVSTIYPILFAISMGHLFNDSIQAVVPALFPILKESMSLTYTQIGWITFSLNMISSLMQPVFGYTGDKKPMPYLLPMGMLISLLGVLILSTADTFYVVLFSVLCIGVASSIFHPEGSRVAYLSSGNRRGFAQAIYQVGGNTGNALAPVFTALIFVPFGQKGALWFAIPAALGCVGMIYVSRWYRSRIIQANGVSKTKNTPSKLKGNLNRGIKIALGFLILITFARSWYSAGISSFYQFYIMEHYGLKIIDAQIYVFIYMISGVLGTFAGGPLSDRFGKRNIILGSMLFSAPLGLLLPHVPLFWVIPLFFAIGFISSTSFSVIVVYAQELLPGHVGTVSGLITGFAFGMGALGSIIIGKMADMYSLTFIMVFCSVLPFIGLVAWLLPNDQKKGISQ